MCKKPARTDTATGTAKDTSREAATGRDTYNWTETLTVRPNPAQDVSHEHSHTNRFSGDYLTLSQMAIWFLRGQNTYRLHVLSTGYSNHWNQFWWKAVQYIHDRFSITWSASWAFDQRKHLCLWQSLQKVVNYQNKTGHTGCGTFRALKKYQVAPGALAGTGQINLRCVLSYI